MSSRSNKQRQAGNCRAIRGFIDLRQQ